MFKRQHYIFSIDSVPGFVVGSDNVPNPLSKKMMKCDRHAVMKLKYRTNPWLRENNNCLFRNLTSGYEKYLLDGARNKLNRPYILMACRLLKTYLKNSKYPNQLSGLITSYHIKNARMHCIFHLHNETTGVKQARGYMMYFLKNAIETNHLPHFFRGNPCVRQMFPNFPMTDRYSPYNLFETINDESLRHGRLGFQIACTELNGLYEESIYLDHRYLERLDNIT